MTVSHTREATALLGAVGVVIVTYQSAPTIRAALASLPIESLAAVVVVDNASSDPSRNIVRGPRREPDDARLLRHVGGRRVEVARPAEPEEVHVVAGRVDVAPAVHRHDGLPRGPAGRRRRPRPQRVDAPLGGHRVGVQEEEQRRRRRPRAHVAPAAEPEVRAGLDHRHPERPRHGGGVVRRRVVDDDDLVAVAQLRAQRLQRPSQLRGAVVGDDDDGDRGVAAGHRAAVILRRSRSS